MLVMQNSLTIVINTSLDEDVLNFLLEKWVQVSRSWEAAKNWFGTPTEKEKEELQKRLSMKQSDKN